MDLHNSKLLRLVETADASPTMIIVTNGVESEAMHSTSGAFGETCYVYLPAIERCFRINSQPNFASVGLGLGYLEMAIAGCYLNMFAHKPANFRITSFECEVILRQHFVDWLTAPSLPQHDSPYDTVAQKFEAHFALEPDCIRKFLHSQFQLGSLRLEGELTRETLQNHFDFDAVLFDAFSQTTSPELWDDDFLKALLLRCSPECVFASYAAPSKLKQHLRDANFSLEPRPGFAKKRECTFAVRP